jgi:ribosomal protein S18 acetylase RimI-like enzyme
MIEMTLRPIDLSRDLPELAEFISPTDVSRLNKALPALRDFDAFAVVGCCGERVVGWGLVHTALRNDMDWGSEGRTREMLAHGDAYLEHLEVRPEFRGLGYGSQLLDALEERTRRVHGRLWLHTSESNKDAQRFYERNSYNHIRTIHPSWNESKPTRIYCKRFAIHGR